MKTRKIKLIALILLASLCMINNKSWSISTGAGAEIYYEHVKDSVYRFYYKLYRPCSSTTPEPDAVSLCFRPYGGACTAGWGTRRMYKMVNGTPDNIANGHIVDTGCPTDLTICTNPNGSLEMYRVWWYSDTVTLGTCGSWLASVNHVERDNTNTSNLMIAPYPNFNLYVEAMVSPLLAPDQSSPVSTVDVPVYAAAGMPFHYNFGMTDPDGDHLKYLPGIPRSATADITIQCNGFSPLFLPYVSGAYNVNTNPLLCNNTYNLNQNTGDIDFTPLAAQSQVAYLAYKVEKYRGGQLIGYVTMDHRLDVRDGAVAPNITVAVDASSLSGAALTGDTVKLCSNTEANFCFSVVSTTTGAQLTVSDNKAQVLPGATVNFSNQQSLNVQGCVSWKPGSSDTGFRWYIIKVKNTTCAPGEVPVIQYYKIPVFVGMSATIIAEQNTICPGSSIQLNAVGGDTYAWASATGGSFSCVNCSSTIFTPANDLEQVVLTTNINNGCPATDQMDVHLDHSNSVNAQPDTVVFCNGGEYLNLSAIASGPPPVQTANCGVFSPATATGLTEVDLMQNSNNSYSSNLFYTWQNYWGPFFQSYYTQKFQFLIRKEELLDAGMKPGSIQRLYLNYGSGPAGSPAPTYSNVRISMRCSDKNEYNNAAFNQFETGLSQVFQANTYTIQPGLNEFVFQTPYDYDTSRNLVIQFCYSGVAPILPLSSGAHFPVYYVPTQYQSSIAAGQASTGNACQANLGQVVIYRRRPDIRFSVSPMPDAPFQYSWTPATGMSNPLAANTGIQVNSSRWFTVTTKGRLGCEVKDSVYAYVATKDFTVVPQETSVCKGDVVQMNGSGGLSYQWHNQDFTIPGNYLDCSNCASVNAGPMPVGDFLYPVIIADTFGCADTLTAVIHVTDIPATHILNNDTTINFGQQLLLKAEGASYYTWTPESSLSTNTGSQTSASPTGSTVYYVRGFAPGGCSNTDSVRVNVRIIEDPFIPNAFSPNGDGLNEVFMPANLTLQRVLLFDVYDRWGKRVYEGGAGAKGWNGRYKNGDIAVLGVYHYFIKLELPDGSLKTYKGDVTLMR